MVLSLSLTVRWSFTLKVFRFFVFLASSPKGDEIRGRADAHQNGRAKAESVGKRDLFAVLGGSDAFIPLYLCLSKVAGVQVSPHGTDFWDEATVCRSILYVYQPYIF